MDYIENDLILVLIQSIPINTRLNQYFKEIEYIAKIRQFRPCLDLMEAVND